MSWGNDLLLKQTIEQLKSGKINLGKEFFGKLENSKLPFYPGEFEKSCACPGQDTYSENI